MGVGLVLLPSKKNPLNVFTPSLYSFEGKFTGKKILLCLCVFLWRGFCAMLMLRTCLQINRVCKSQNVAASVCWDYWVGDTSLNCLFLLHLSDFFLLSPAFQKNERSWNPL